jgi:hypothetical protein
MELKTFVQDFLQKNKAELLNDPEGKTTKIDENLAVL